MCGMGLRPRPLARLLSAKDEAMRFKTLISMLLVLVALVVTPANAQTALTATTLSSAMTATQTTATVASATNLVAGWYLYIDREAILIRSISGTTAVVSRGVAGTAPASHGSGAGVLAQTPSAFYMTDVSGSCVTTAETYLPHINVVSGNIMDCLPSSSTLAYGAGYWVRYKQMGFTVPSFYGTGTVYTYASGAILIRPGVHLITATGGTYTLAAPTEAQNGVVMTILSTVAQTNTVTVTGGVDGTSSHDACAFAAAIGNHLTLVAVHGAWYLISAQGITVS
jgi:hypothetical protein